MINVSPPTTLLHYRWLDIIAHYSRLSLTFPSDTLPALAGLAKQFRHLFACKYHAGLWEHTFAMDLLWRTRDPKSQLKQHEWRAPSWSWASTIAAVDYYHLLMAFDLDSHTFRYSISHSLISEVVVECETLDGGEDTTMGLRSGKVALEGFLFAVYLSSSATLGAEAQDSTNTSSTKWTDEEIESLRPHVEEAIVLPKISVPESDIRYFPLERCMNSPQEISFLAHDTGMSFVSEKNKKKEVRNVLDVWWDYGSDERDAEGKREDDKGQNDEVVDERGDYDRADTVRDTAGTGEAEREQYEMYPCLLVARHESAMDTAYFSLILKPVDDDGTYERIGLFRHEDMPEVGGPRVITIV